MNWNKFNGENFPDDKWIILAVYWPGVEIPHISMPSIGKMTQFLYNNIESKLKIGGEEVKPEIFWTLFTFPPGKKIK
jgi:hypothetical protein